MKNILIIGSSGHAKVVIDTAEKQGKYNIVGLIDRFRESGEKTLGYKVMGGETDIPQIVQTQNIYGLIVAIGDNHLRQMVVKNIKALLPRIAFVSAIHPSASIAKNVRIKQGTVIMAGAVINADSEIGEHCIINTRASLDHDSIMGDYSSLAPNATTGGNCEIGKKSAIGISATLLHGIAIGNSSIIGAGSLVTKSIPGRVVAFGVPAKVKRHREEGEKYL